MLYDPILLESGDASLEGYIVDPKAPNLRNFLNKHIDAVDAGKIADVLGIHARNVLIIEGLNVPVPLQGQGIGSKLLYRALLLPAAAVILISDSKETQKKGFDLSRFYEDKDFACVTQGSAGPVMLFPSSLAHAIVLSLRDGDVIHPRAKDQC